MKLGSAGELFDEELEVVGTGERHHGCFRVPHAHTQCGCHGPAERPGLAGIDPAAWLVDVEELGAGNLGEPDVADVAGFLPNTLFISS